MSDGENPGRAQRRPRIDADKDREPELIPGQLGTRWISLNALVERIEAAFMEEHESDSPALLEADSPAKRLKLVLETADYVLSVESVQPSREEKAEIISRVYSNLFGYGPLDPLFANERITTISLEGADKAAVRYGHGELVSLKPIFHDEAHLRRILRRLLIDGRAELREDQPYVEFGLRVGQRPVSVNLVAPPAAFQLSADIRVHPVSPPSADRLVADGFMSEKASQLLRALAESPYGLLIVGEPESGKTTLLGLLANWLPEPERTVAVERAGELRLPSDMKRRVVQWPFGDQPGVTFGEQIGLGLQDNPACILLDEVRADEPETIAPLLSMPNAPRLIWSFRGAIFAKRLQSALGMLARRANTEQGEELVRALFERLPFVVTVNRVNDSLRLWSIGEWQFRHSPNYPTYTLLMQVEQGELKFTGERPSRPLKLLDEFWGQS